jgi:hypothetical protein
MIGDWVKFMRENHYLGMGIPSTIKEHLNVRVIYGNPFDHTITIKRNSEMITEATPATVCMECNTAHSYSGGCLNGSFVQRTR